MEIIHIKRSRHMEACRRQVDNDQRRRLDELEADRMAGFAIPEPSLDRSAEPTLRLGWRERLPDDFLGVFSVEMRDFSIEIWRVRSVDGARKFRFLRCEANVE